MAGVYAWIREGVRRAVLLGFSDAVEELGIPQDAEGVNQHLAGVLKQRTIGEPLTATARTLRTMMESVVEATAKAAELPRFTSGGKTGTSELPDSDGDGEKDLIASFCGFFPVSQPRAVILVKLDRPTGELGSRVAAPIFAEVADVVADALGVPADKAGVGR